MGVGKRLLVYCVVPFLVSPAYSRTLLGKAEKTECIFQSETPSEDKDIAILWDLWRKKVQDEIHNRIRKRLAEMGVPTSGYVIIEYEVSRRGQVVADVIKDNSVNMGLIAPNCIESLAGDDILTFPAKSRREKITTKLTIRMDKEETDLYYVGDVEHIR